MTASFLKIKFLWIPVYLLHPKKPSFLSRKSNKRWNSLQVMQIYFDCHFIISLINTKTNFQFSENKEKY